MEKHFCIDAGNGEKMNGCPYSLFEDGHDVKDYIVPPKGYEFVGFKLIEIPNNQIYDGKLVAQYKKLPWKERFTSVARGLIIALGVLAVIGIIIALTVSIFKTPNPSQKNKTKPQDEKPLVTDSVKPALDTTTLTPSHSPEPEPTPSEEHVAAQVAPIETQPVPSDDPNVQFKQAFWDLIHQRTIMMDPYDELYKNYKDKASGEEYDYLRFTILKNFDTYKEWYRKLNKVPQNELEGINSIEALVQKLKEY